MGEIKTKPVDHDIDSFLKGIEPEKKRTDSIALRKLFESVLSEKPVLWNNNMIGYGTYHYKSDRSSQEGDWPLTAFSPRKQNITIYIMTGVNKYKDLLTRLGKYKVSSGSCLYINKLDDINPDVLKEIISASVSEMKSIHGIR